MPKNKFTDSTPPPEESQTASSGKDLSPAQRAIANYITNHPHMTYEAIARVLGVSTATVARISLTSGQSRRPGLSLDQIIANIDKERG